MIYYKFSVFFDIKILPLFCDILLVCKQENLYGGSFSEGEQIRLTS